MIDNLPLWLCTFCTVLAVYLHLPSLHHLGGGDSGELLSEACVGGVAHPPGYPLLLGILRIVRSICILVRTELPFVYVANTVNAVFAAGAAACITKVVEMMTDSQSPLESMTAGVLFALSRTTWEHALGLEVRILMHRVFLVE